MVWGNMNRLRRYRDQKRLPKSPKVCSCVRADKELDFFFFLRFQTPPVNIHEDAPLRFWMVPLLISFTAKYHTCWSRTIFSIASQEECGIIFSLHTFPNNNIKKCFGKNLGKVFSILCYWKRECNQSFWRNVLRVPSWRRTSLSPLLIGRASMLHCQSFS